MTLHYAREATKGTPQSRKAHTQQVANSAGGYSFPLDAWGRLDRFLILGTEGGTYYIGQRELTRENAQNVLACLATDGLRVVKRIVEVSDQGLAHKNDPALFALALASIDPNPRVRKAAFDALSSVARIGTHLFTFIDYRQTLGGGWGRGMREAIGAWYLGKRDDKLAYQLIKYRQRNGWSHRDVLRKAHPQAFGFKDAAFGWVTQGEYTTALSGTLIEAFEAAQSETDKGKLIQLITDNRLPREAIPTEWLTDPAVLRALLQDMPMTAMIRNLVNLTKHGVLTNGGAETKLVIQRLRDEERIRNARIHPLSVLLALKVYERGTQRRGGYSYWGQTYRPRPSHTPVTPVLDALEDAYYLAFQNVEPTDARMLLAVDVSSSMRQLIPGTSLMAHEAAAAMSMVTARTETFYDIRGFSTDFADLGITKRDKLTSAMQKVQRSFGGTDCALPMNWARSQKREYDAFVIYTDSETWAGRTNHPFEALEWYRQKMGIPAKLIVVGMTSNGFTIADPNDAGSLDIVGFDASAPAVISNFIRAGAS